MSDFFGRLYLEQQELVLKINKLEFFMKTQEYREINERHQGLLGIQLSAMQTYFNCLNERMLLLASESQNK